jgi:5-formyltetrahydrofolate cyclo-ligase
VPLLRAFPVAVPRPGQRSPDRPVDGTAHAKDALRHRVWTQLERQGIARFPRPVYGRIPNFEGAEDAARRLAGEPEFQSARVLKVNPDAPQRPVRYQALLDGRRVVMPTPRLRGGFVLLDPSRIPAGLRRTAASLRGAFQHGRPLALGDLPPPDLIVVGSVAVAPTGARVGKGEGYSELEFAVLAELGLVRPHTPIATTVHDVQVVDPFEVEPFDVPVDLIATPTRVLRTRTHLPRPPGILWELVTEEMLDEMPVLRELYRRRGKAVPG